MSFELSKSCLKFKFKHVTIATYDVTFILGTACESFAAKAQLILSAVNGSILCIIHLKTQRLHNLRLC